METIGIDLHPKRTRYVRMSQDGRVTRKASIDSTPESFRKAFEGCDAGGTRIAMEATGNWYWAVDVLEELGLEVHLANPRKVRLIAESTIKTDTVDATALANLLRMDWLPESRITPVEARLLRERLRYRITLVRIRSAIKCRIHALLDKQGILAPELSDLFGKTGRAWLEKVHLAAEYRENVDGYLRTLDFLGEEIERVEKWLEASTRKNRDIHLLMGIPGIGRFGAALILAEIGDIGFFRDKRRLSSFVGVVPGADNSNLHTRDTGLKRDSNPYIRWLLAEAATKGMRVVPAWGRLYERVHAGNDKRRAKARMAVMHKMVCAIWRVLTTKQPFDRLHNCPELEDAKKDGELANGTGLKQDRVSD
jgi:transposase